MAENISTRVNAALLPQYVGQTVRLTCKVLKFKGESALVEASDGAEVEIRLSRDAKMTDTFVEVVGSVVDASTVKMMTCINVGDNLDMQLVDDAIKLTHDPRFKGKLF